MHWYNSLLYLTRNYLTRSSLLSIYYSLVYSCISYSNIIWSKTSKQNSNRLVTAQKKIIRTIMFRNRFFHTNADLHNLKVLDIEKMNKYFAGIFVYKSLSNLCYPQNYFFSTEHFVKTYNLRNLVNHRPPHTSFLQGQSSPTIYCTHIWNDIPIGIRLKPLVTSFRFAFRQHLQNS